MREIVIERAQRKPAPLPAEGKLRVDAGVGKRRPLFSTAGKYGYDNQVSIEVEMSRFGTISSFHYT
jgi:hypothetical protein